jgi:cell division protease FtsH
MDTLKKRIDDLQAGAKLLLERETITPDEFPAISYAEA